MVEKKVEVTALDRINWIVNTIFHQTVAVVTAYMLWIICSNFQFNSVFTWHMFLAILSDKRIVEFSVLENLTTSVFINSLKINTDVVISPLTSQVRVIFSPFMVTMPDKSKPVSDKTTIICEAREGDSFSVFSMRRFHRYMPLMAEAIILFTGENVWSQKIDRTKKYWIHGGLMFLSFCMITVGIFLETYNKGSKRTHFQSIHAITGLISYVFFVLLLLPGVFAAKCITLNKKVRPVYFKFIHNMLGMTCYVLGLVSLTYGLKKHSFGSFSGETTTSTIIFLIWTVAVWSLIAPLLSAYHQVKAILRK